MLTVSTVSCRDCRAGTWRWWRFGQFDGWIPAFERAVSSQAQRLDRVYVCCCITKGYCTARHRALVLPRKKAAAKHCIPYPVHQRFKRAQGILEEGAGDRPHNSFPVYIVCIHYSASCSPASLVCRTATTVHPSLAPCIYFPRLASNFLDYWYSRMINRLPCFSAAPSHVLFSHVAST